MRTISFRLHVLSVVTGALTMTHAVNADEFVTLMAPEYQMTHAVNADEFVTSIASEYQSSLVAPKYQSSLVNMTGPKGFVTQFMTVDRGTLVEQLVELRSSQIERKQELAGELDEKKFDTTDVILTLVLPGGLIYAGYKKAAYASTRNSLTKVSKNIAENSSDLSSLQGRMPPVAVAQLK